MVHSCEKGRERAEDGISCVNMPEKAAAGYCGLVLTDIQMPHMDVYRATQTIRLFSDKRKAAVPIIAMSANAFERTREAPARRE